MFCCGGSAASATAPRLRVLAPPEWDPPDPLLAIYGSAALPPLHLIPTEHLPLPRSRDPFSGVLTPRQAALLCRALPSCARAQRWQRVYHLTSHGASLSTLLRRSRGLAPTVLAARTAGGVTLGAFCPSPWWDAHPAKLGQHVDMPPNVEGSSFFGFGGGAFVFSFAGAGGACLYSDTPGFDISAWRAGLPQQLQYLFIEPKKGSGGVATRLGVGGGGDSFALLLDEALERGLTGSCAAFESGSLLGAESAASGGHFIAVDVEVWAFGEKDAEVEVRTPSLFSGADGAPAGSAKQGAPCAEAAP
jgi:hypothetical protein